jgi:hypothetical protein
MKIHILIYLMIIISGLISVSFAETGTGMPLKYISSCEIDLNDDNEPDIAMLVETIRGRELIVLMRTGNGYNAFVVARDKANMFLSCHFGKYVKETGAGKGGEKRKVYETPGTYIKLTQPEGSSVVYFWTGKGFKEVWTSD